MYGNKLFASIGTNLSCLWKLYKTLPKQFELHSMIVANSCKLALSKKTVRQPIDCHKPSYRSSLGNGQLPADTLIAEKTNWPPAACRYSYNGMHPIHLSAFFLHHFMASWCIWSSQLRRSRSEGAKEIDPWWVDKLLLSAYNGIYRPCVRTYNRLFSRVHLQIALFLLWKKLVMEIKIDPWVNKLAYNGMYRVAV